MGDRLSRDQEAVCLSNLAEVLREVAAAMRLFSDTEKLGGAHLSRITALSLAVDVNADTLEDLALEGDAA